MGFVEKAEPTRKVTPGLKKKKIKAQLGKARRRGRVKKQATGVRV